MPTKGRPRTNTAAGLGTPDELRKKLAEVRKSRVAAEKKGSWSSVMAGHRLEADILKALQPVAAPVAANPYAELDDDAILRIVGDLVRDLPDALVERVDDVVGARLGRKVLRVVKDATSS